jgi:hypothetical protein
MRRLLFSRWGLAEDPTGYQVTFDIGDRHYLADVIGFYRSEARGVTMLKVRHFNGDPIEDVAASVVKVLGPRYEAAQIRDIPEGK